MEITLEAFERLPQDRCQLIDIRTAEEFSRGSIPGAVHIPLERLAGDARLRRDRRIVLFCRRGEASLRAADDLRAAGYDAWSLQDGWNGWVLARMRREMDGGIQAHVEESLRKKFHKRIFSAFTKAVRQYRLVLPGDRVAVCISGGKDSMLLAKLFQELQRHNKFPFEARFLVMDPGYAPPNRALIEENARLLGVPISIFESNIFDSVYHVEKNPCYLCARMRRGHLYRFARELGCNKIALGHHYDDVIETTLMGMLWGGQVQTMMPKLHSANFPGMELIRPLYLVREADIKAWRDYNGLLFLQCACRFTDSCSLEGEQTRSRRAETKRLISELKKTNPAVEANIFRSMENVCLDTVVAYKSRGERHHFLDDYDAVRGGDDC